MERYYPTRYSGCNPIHEVMDWAYVRRIVRAARRGDAIPPIVIEGSRGNGNLITGTHRSAANDLMYMLEDEKDAGPQPYIGLIGIDDVLEDMDPEDAEMLREAVEESAWDRIDDILDRGND